MMERIETVLREELVPALKRAVGGKIYTGREDPHDTDRGVVAPPPGAAGHFYAQYHNMPEICWCRSGGFRLQLDDNLYRLKAGDVCFIGRNRHHFESYEARRHDYECVWIVFPRIDRIGMVHNRYRNLQVKYLQSLTIDIPDTFVKTVDALTDFGAGTAAVRRHVKKLGTLLESFLDDPPGKSEYFDFISRKKSNFQVRRIMQACDHIRAHFAEKLTLKDVAVVAGLNPEYFDRLFSRINRTTFVRFLTSVRLQEAQRFMNDTSMTIAEISYRVGFNDPYYFSKVFKSYYGLSPRQFRDRYTVPSR